jgi:hypothetical protein
MITYLIVCGLATAVILLGYVMGRNVLFSPHGGMGWLFVVIALAGGAIAGAIGAAMQPKGRKAAKLFQVLVCLALFVAISIPLIRLMPNAWNNWIFPYSVADK